MQSSIKEKVKELTQINALIKGSTNSDKKLLSRRDELAKSLHKASIKSEEETSKSSLSNRKKAIESKINKLAEMNSSIQSTTNDEEREKLKQRSLALSSAIKEEAKELRATLSNFHSTSKREEIKDPSKSSLKSERASVSGSKSALDKFDNIFKDSSKEKSKAGNSSGSTNISVDICFLIDGTRSMEPWIDSVKNKVAMLIKKVEKNYKNITSRVGYIVYRDFNLKDDSFNVFDFTETPEKLELSLSEVKTASGDDEPEDINGAMQLVLSKMKWKANVRVLVHFADAPCHGSEYHDLEDHYENPKTDVDWRILLKNLRKNNIFYNFMELNSKKTRKMTDKFERMWNQVAEGSESLKHNIAAFKVYPVDANYDDLFPKIEKSIKESMNKSIRDMTNPDEILKKLHLDNRNSLVDMLD